MTNLTEKNNNAQKMNITIQGRKVVLLFTEKANSEVATTVKQALLGTYMFTASDEIAIQSSFTC